MARVQFHGIQLLILLKNPLILNSISNPLPSLIGGDNVSARQHSFRSPAFFNFGCFSFIFATFRFWLLLSLAAGTHPVPAQPEATESLAPTWACVSSQMTCLIQRLALQAAPIRWFCKPTLACPR